MIRQQRDHVLAVAENVLDEAAQGAFGADLDEGANAGVIHRL